MKNLIFTITLLLGLQLSLSAGAQNEKVTLRVPNFVRPLVEKWIAEYQKTNTQVDFQFVSGKSQDNADNNITFTTDADAVAFARYAVLPVTASGSQAQQLVAPHRLNSKRLKNLFFIKDEWDGEAADKQDELHVYTGNSQQSVSRTYAAHFGTGVASYKGKKLSGDDSFLNTAVSRDPLGVTVNALPNLFDLQSRRLRQGLALLPLDVDKQSRQTLDGGQLDDILQLLEQQQYSEIPVGRIGFSYNHANSRLADFVRWALANGTQYVHEFGLLSLSQKELTAQARRAEQKDLAQK